MKLLYWDSAVHGLHRGTITCLDGHVHLTNVPVAQRDFVEGFVRRFGDSCDRLPPRREATAEALVTIGFARCSAGFALDGSKVAQPAEIGAPSEPAAAPKPPKPFKAPKSPKAPKGKTAA